MLIEEIKMRLNIIDLAKEACPDLKKQSQRLYKAKCIFHNDIKTPNLFFYADTNTFKCYACDAHGDAINFYAKLHNLSNPDAIKELANSFTLQGATYTPQHATTHKRGLVRHNTPIRGDYTLIYTALKDFSGELSEETLNYLKGDKRGLTDETIKRFSLFEIKDYKKTREFLVKNFKENDLKEAGLLYNNNRFAFTKNKIVIPVKEDGKITALRARFFDKGLDDPNLLQTPTYTYPKYESTKGISGKFFNSDILKDLKAGGRVYLAEGEFDAMIAEQNGLKTIGLLGVSNYSDKMIKRLKDFDLFICLDNDEAGKKQAYNIADIFKEVAHKDANISRLPDGIKDLTEFYIKKQKVKNS